MIMASELTRIKAFDLYGQIAMVALPILIDLALQDARFIFYILFTLGTWQVVSALIHLRFPKEAWIIRGRRMYLTMLAIVFSVLILTGLLTLMNNDFGTVLFVEAYAMLLIGAGMGIWYMTISAIELKNTKRITADNWINHIGEQP